MKHILIEMASLANKTEEFWVWKFRGQFARQIAPQYDVWWHQNKCLDPVILKIILIIMLVWLEINIGIWLNIFAAINSKHSRYAATTILRTVHTVRTVMKLPRQSFGERIISRECNIDWSSQSTDVTSSDVFLWEYLKENIYFNQTFQYMQDTLRLDLWAQEPEQLRNMMETVPEKTQLKWKPLAKCHPSQLV